ncbi:hypothetical protein BO71DRAFT_404272 [Aspergillus ellipticus CBS 707.79]|uniref:Zn(2)-C6 fungal-type domain-containing protein n=1 Tax=Aspergillus ellipticus CBS 707.79 TaxID=1448320 RepID=A0A319CU37_9EURO|nr:hypothetical protein BO71DRAFT_404272 [Aspergillus ellipticus CBS 707.79]
MSTTAVHPTRIFKRRRLRKGTHSCWECKRRKTRCTFANPTDASSSCIGCRQRGTSCVSQEVEETGPPVTNPIFRVEALIQQLIHQGPTSQSPPQHSSTPPPTSPSPIPSTGRKDAELARLLHAACPSPHDARSLIQATQKTTVCFHQIITRPQQQLEQDGVDAGWPFASPGLAGADTHPVLLARQMLLLASLLQQQLAPSKLPPLSENPERIRHRLAETAIRLVTANDDLAGSTESLECIVLEGMYHASGGRVRRAWKAFRRALATAQLMGLHDPTSPPPPSLDPQPPASALHPHALWWRMVEMDCALSLMLGLPAGTPDPDARRLDAIDTPLGRLELCHAQITARLLKPNPVADEPATGEKEDALPPHVRTLDCELVRAAESVPSHFWLPPDFLQCPGDVRRQFRETLHLGVQLAHWHLVMQLHLPYLLRELVQTPTDVDPASSRHYTSRVRCIHAGRAILTRFVAYSTVSLLTYCCRRLDTFALAAGMTLLLTQLLTTGPDPLLTHHQPEDRALVEQTVAHIARIRGDDDGPLIWNGVQVLRRLLQIVDDETGTAVIRAELLPRSHSHEPDPQTCLRISFPSIGVVQITRTDGGPLPQSSVLDEPNELKLTSEDPSVAARPPQASDSYPPTIPSTVWSPTSPSPSSPPPLPEISRTRMPPYAYSSGTTSIEDWGFQGPELSLLDGAGGVAETDWYDGDGSGGMGMIFADSST